jgi:nitrogen-specific signal transduction histidine kinase
VALLPPGGAFGPEAQAIVQIEDRTDTRRADQLRSDFVANASHELRTPLASIIGYIETLQHHARDDPEARERFLGIMGREAARMQRLVDDLMSLSRIEMSEHLRPAEAWSLNRIAGESASALSAVAHQLGVEIEVEVPADGAVVLGDRDQLTQVFANLIDNAMKHGGAGTAIRVVPAPPSPAHPGRVGVTVEDSGPGIAREHLHRLTERFYRVSATSSRSKGGTGLGLAIVKHILNRHAGRLEIASTPGQGSAFTVWLPEGRAGERRSPSFFRGELHNGDRIRPGRRNHRLPYAEGQAVLMQVREVLTNQAIARLRLVAPTGRKHVLILCKIPVADLPVSGLLEWDDLACPRLRAAIAAAPVIGPGVRRLRLSAQGLHEDAPGMFETTGAAKAWRRGRTTNSLLVASAQIARGLGTLAVPTLVAGKVGGRPTPAIELI